jgi:nucleoside-diphosphate-sugar epimerase
MMRAYYKGFLTLFPGPETKLAPVHVEDVAEGHLLAAEKGRIGESYILAGPGLSFLEMAKLWAQASGKPAPLAFVPARYLRAIAPLVGQIQKVLPLPQMLSQDGANIMGATYLGSSEKASRELGWRARTQEDGFRETFESLAQDQTPGYPLSLRQRKAVGLAAAALAVLLIWRKKRKAR